MVSQELIDWIGQQLQTGYTQEQVYNYMLQSGYQEKDIKEAFAGFQAQQPTKKNFDMSKLTTKPVILTIAGILLVLILGMTALLIPLDSNTDAQSQKVQAEPERQEMELTFDEEPKTQEPQVEVVQTPTKTEETLVESTPAECPELAASIKDCEEYSCEFVHPISLDLLTRDVLGVIDGKCHYIEEMPNNGLMTCEYPGEYLDAISEYYADTMSGQEMTTSVSISGGKMETVYTIDDVEVNNPLQKAMEEGICKIEGYE